MKLPDEWLAYEEARDTESKVIRLPALDRTLLNGWRSSEMKLYCQLWCEDRDD